MSSRVLIIGNGKWSKVLQRVLSELGVEHEVSTRDWAAKLSGITHSIIATPAEAHFTIANELIKQGIPTLIEKPAVITMAHAEVLAHHSKISGTPIFCHTPYLYHSIVERIKQNLKNSDSFSYHSYRANVEGGHKDGNSFINHGAHDLANLWYFGHKEEPTVKLIKNDGYKIMVDLVTNKGDARIITEEYADRKVRSICVEDEFGMQQFVNDSFYLEDGIVCPEYTVIDEPLKLSLTDFIMRTSAKCGIDFIKWSAKVLQLVKDI